MANLVANKFSQLSTGMVQVFDQISQHYEKLIKVLFCCRKSWVKKIMGEEQVPCPIVLKVIDSHRVSNTSDLNNRYRLLVSDGDTIHS